MKNFKNLLSILLLFIVVFTLTSCDNEEEINLSVSNESLSIVLNAKMTLDFETNDKDGVVFNSSDEAVVLVNEEGVIEALSLGTATVTITSKTDSNVSVSVSITVIKQNPTEIKIIGEDKVFLGSGTQLNLEIVPNHAKDEVIWSSSDESIATVDENGLVTTVGEGEVTIIATSAEDTNIKGIHEITVLLPSPTSLVIEGKTSLLLTETMNLTVTVDPILASNEVKWSSSDENIVTVDDNGLVTPVGEGQVTITAVSMLDESIANTMEITVANNILVDKNVVSGDTFEYLGYMFTYGVNLFNNIQEAIDVATSDVNIYITPGIYEDNFTINKNGIHLLGANYDKDSNLVTRTEETVLKGVITIGECEDIIINGFKFTDTAQIVSESDHLINKLEISYNLIENINYSTSEIKGFIQFVSSSIDTGVQNISITHNQFDHIYATENEAKLVRPIWISYTKLVNITNNVFSNYDRDVFIEYTSGTILVKENSFENNSARALQIVGFLDGDINVSENSFKNSNDWAIAIWGKSEYEHGILIEVTHNTIDTALKGIMIDPEYKNSQGSWVADKIIFANANYNIIKNVTSYYGYSSDVYPVDFTKNYWGTETPIIDQFGNLTENEYRDYYTTEEEVPSSEETAIVYPNDIIISNPIANMNSGDTYQLNLQVLPIDASINHVYWLSSDQTIVSVSQDGLLTAIKSGIAEIMVTSADNSKIIKVFTVVVDAEAGIKLSFSNTDNNLIVGDTLEIAEKAFPVSEIDHEVIWSSSDEQVATVDQNGLVTTISEGVVTITVSFADNELIRTSVTLNVYNQLDMNNLFDLISMYQTISSKSYYFTSYGATNYTVNTNKSIASYFYDRNVIQQDIIGISDYTRTGRLMSSIPNEYPSYNEDNINWIVVHDTANTSSSATAAMHALYLHNLTNNPSNTTYVSWHYTVDENEIIHHIPDNERAFHAGDGSRLVGEGNYEGGGNTNGIGIEMAVNKGSDIYKTWHKTAKLVAMLLVKYNLPIDNYKFHHDFSGKDCPRTLRNARLTSEFRKMVEIEYEIRLNHKDAKITMKSNYPEYLDDSGRIIKLPLLPMTVSYDVTVTENGVTETRTFYTYLPGSKS
ncbi:Ig-like domain-containing protein [Mycoplasmatota bacterium]|nr:Ig-like domain-containing protein [Mycoplasmatota bacterium]